METLLQLERYGRVGCLSSWYLLASSVGEGRYNAAIKLLDSQGIGDALSIGKAGREPLTLTES
jgi:hypothetical protein